MADWDIASSAIALVLFLLVAYAAIAATRKVSATSNKASSRLAAHGIELSESKISVKTDRPPMSREEQVQSSQAAVGAAARYVAERPQAFSVGEESPARGFRRTKKLD